MSWNNGGQGPWGGPPGGGAPDDGKPGGPKSGGPKPAGAKDDAPADRPGRGPQRGPQRGPLGGPRPGPWGQPGGANSPLPDIDRAIAGLQDWVRSQLGGRGGNGRGGGGPLGGGPRGGLPGASALGGGRGLALLAIALVAVWLATGFYRVQPDEQGVVLRFGAFARTTLPGLNYHLPWPVEAVERPAVTRINRTEIGYRSAGGADPRTADPAREVPEESLMLTGDENIIDINFALFWRINDASRFLFDLRGPEITIKSVAESVIREVIGRTPIQEALAARRAQIEAEVHTNTQAILDRYGAGVEITQVQLQRVDPPNAVIDSFRDVQRANTDADRARNEAESYRNDIIPRARGDAARITAEAEGARQAGIAEATGQAQRFLSVLAAYQAAKDVTLQRMYIETMQDILTHTPTVVLDESVRNLVPFLPLNDLGRTAAPPAPGLAPPAAPPAKTGAK